MRLAEKLVQEFEKLPEEKKKEVIDFVEFLKQKDKKDKQALMDGIIDENAEALRELAK
ncbi:DUF2281 domain-containing protein [Lutispora sp.]|uniref:DUF2281 domain-containing protein n=1 Tax=Lutispora sp. TaxID=2828727 RepID=UPI002B1EC1D4|nr:DUF2281 domain-containing protein [Lutispora sp.]MEA4960260.1 DUF2281 domain-containing protein [Lutispora sp.]